LRKNNKASKRYHCDICNKSYEPNHALELHKPSQKHINKAAGVTKIFSRPRNRVLTDANRAQRKFHCAICDLACANNSKLEKHKKTERHIEKAAKGANSMT
jgi:Pyruvate/2-oxoacid:ferredoxin oxidoreductase delta subunit